jgi:lysophospholipase L1-like esterase
VFTINLGEANITKTVELTSSPHAASSAITPPTTMSYLNSIQYSSAYDFEVLSPTVSNERILIYGDSISQGSRAINIMTEGYIPLLRNTYQFEDVMSEGRGYRSLYDDAFTEQQRNDFVQRLASYAPATLYLAMGTNDNGILSTWGGINNFQTAYEDFLVKLHIALPNARIIVQPLLAGLNTNSASQAIKNASTGKNYITLIDPSSWLAS